MEEIDFSTPLWLTTYYHVIGTVSLIFDAFAIYLVLFKSSKIDNFRYFLLNFQIACSLTDIHLTFLMQPIPLYPLLSGFAVGFLPAHFGTSCHACLTVIIFLLIYQIGSMIVCFIRKHQAIGQTLGARYKMPNVLVAFFLLFFLTYTAVVTGFWSILSIPVGEQLDYVLRNHQNYLDAFRRLPNFSIYEANRQFLIIVIFAVSGGILAFFVLILTLFNIFRLLAMLKLKISSSSYQKHRVAIRSLMAQFATSSVCFVPPIFFVFVVLIGVPRAQVIVEFLLVIACLHSSLNVIVLIITFPPYRKFVKWLIFRKAKDFDLGQSRISAKPSVVVSHLAK